MFTPVKNWLLSLSLAMACIVTSAGCDLQSPSGQDEPKERRVLVFWDVSTSITPPERARWKAHLRERTDAFGSQLWEQEAFDEVTILPVHRYTLTSIPLVQQRFTGGVYTHHEIKQQKQRAAFAAQLNALDTLQLKREVLKGTDLLASIHRINEYMAGDTARVREVVYFSDMLNATPELNFESLPSPFVAASPEAMAREVIEKKGWPAGMLSGVIVAVYLPGTFEGALVHDEARIVAVASFWGTLFEELGADVKHWRRT